MRKLKFKLVRNVIPLYGTSYTTCIGCDTTFNEMLNIKEDCIKQTGRANRAGHNNLRDASSSTSTSSTSQSRSIQPVSSSTGSVRNNNDVNLLGTSGTSRRHVQSNSSNMLSIEAQYRTIEKIILPGLIRVISTVQKTDQINLRPEILGTRIQRGVILIMILKLCAIVMRLLSS